MRPLTLVAVTALLVGAGCSDASGPDGGPADASFIAGDAGPGDDAEPRDAGGTDASDASPLDTGPEPDAGTMDAESMDVDPCAAPSVETLSASAAAARADVLAGEVVTLTGTATATALDCTERACPEDNPCCNTCTAWIEVGEVRLAASECFAADPGCAGSECNQTCRPPLLGLPQSFRGVLSTAAPDLQLLLFDVR